MLNGALDFSIHLKRDRETVKGVLTKNRNGACDFVPAFTIRAVEIGVDQDGDAVTAAIAEQVDRLPEAPLREKEQNVLDALEEIAADGRTVSAEDWQVAALRLGGLSDSDNVDTQRRAYRRFRDSLVECGKVRKVTGGYRLAGISAWDFDFGDLDDDE